MSIKYITNVRSKLSNDTVRTVYSTYRSYLLFLSILTEWTTFLSIIIVGVQKSRSLKGVPFV